MGGGSPAGTADWPAYLVDVHENWLTSDDMSEGRDAMNNSIVELMNVSHTDAGNPYFGETAFDPNAALTLTSGSPLKDMETAVSAAEAVIAALNTSSNWGTMVDTAVGKFTSFADVDFLNSLNTAITGLLTALDTILDSSYIDNMVDSFETSKKTRFLRGVGLWAGGMADINAVNTSSFVMGMALRQKDFADSVDQYARELRVNVYSRILTEGISAHLKANILLNASKNELVLKGPVIAAEIGKIKSAMYTELLRMQVEVERLTVIAMSENKDEQINLDAREALWDYEVYMYGANLLSSISGAAAGRKEPKKGMSALSGALAGASIGAGIGPAGSAAGALIGGAAGAILSLLD